MRLSKRAPILHTRIVLRFFYELSHAAAAHPAAKSGNGPFEQGLAFEHAAGADEAGLNNC
jgi:hypothetical protein